MADLIDIGQSNQDYRRYGLKENILPTPGDLASHQNDPFEGEIPDDAQGYRQYRDHYEAKMDNMITDVKTKQKQGFMQQGINCEDKAANGQPLRMNRKKPAHEGAGIVCACNHVIHQDPVNPAGVYFVPFKRGGTAGYFLCPICHKSLLAKRLDIGTQVSMKCADCVLEAIEEIQKLRPERLHNLSAN
jgi:hypothetical protein